LKWNFKNREIKNKEVNKHFGVWKKVGWGEILEISMVSFLGAGIERILHNPLYT
jgi:hypothetical protein